MGQSFDSGLDFGLGSLVGRHVCFLTFLQPADNSRHNAAAQIGLRGFWEIADPDKSSTVCGQGWGRREKNGVSYLSFKTQAESSIKGNDN